MPLGPWDSVFSGKVFCIFLSPLVFSGFLQGLCICLLIAPSLWMKKTLAFPCSPPFQILQFPEKGLPELQGPLVPKPPGTVLRSPRLEGPYVGLCRKEGTLGETVMRRVLAAWNPHGMPAPL